MLSARLCEQSSGAQNCTALTSRQYRAILITPTAPDAIGRLDNDAATPPPRYAAVTNALISFAIRASDGWWMYIMWPASK